MIPRWSMSPGIGIVSSWQGVVEIGLRALSLVRQDTCMAYSTAEQFGHVLPVTLNPMKFLTGISTPVNAYMYQENKRKAWWPSGLGF